MVDDEDRCEWVNVSSGTGSPGESWTKGHKTVVDDDDVLGAADGRVQYCGSGVETEQC